MMRLVFLVLGLLLSTNCFSQYADMVLGSMKEVKQKLHHQHWKNLEMYTRFLIDSGTCHRMDSLHADRVVINGYLRKNRCETTEYYFTKGDSIPFTMYEYSRFENVVYGFDQESLRADSVKGSVEFRHMKFIDTCFHACLVPSRLKARRTMRAVRKTYYFQTYLEADTRTVRLWVSVPPKFGPVIVRRYGGKF